MMNKNTRNNIGAEFNGTSQAGETSRDFSATYNHDVNSAREFNGRADFSSDRTFTDRMAVIVVDVLPNGNLVVEGYRTRVVSRRSGRCGSTGIVPARGHRPGEHGAVAVRRELHGHLRRPRPGDVLHEQRLVRPASSTSSGRSEARMARHTILRVVGLVTGGRGRGRRRGPAGCASRTSPSSRAPGQPARRLRPGRRPGQHRQPQPVHAAGRGGHAPAVQRHRPGSSSQRAARPASPRRATSRR